MIEKRTTSGPFTHLVPVLSLSHLGPIHIVVACRREMKEEEERVRMIWSRAT